MDADRLRTGELIAGISGVILLVVMFLPWFGLDFGVPEEIEDLGLGIPAVDESVNISAWEAFDFIDLVLLVTAVVAIGTAVMTATASTVALPVAASAITAGLGIISTLLVLYRILDTPGGTDRKFGVFVGLIAAAGVAYGGWRLMQEEGTTFGGEAAGVGDQFGGGGDAPPPPAAPGDPPSSVPPPSSSPPPQ